MGRRQTVLRKPNLLPASADLGELTGNIQAGQWGAELFDPRIIFGHLRDSDFGGFLHAPFDAFIVQGIFVFGVFVARVFRSGANGGSTDLLTSE